MEPTQNTIRDNPDQPVERSGPIIGVRVQALIVGLLGLALCFTAIPRFLTAAQRLPANAVLDRLANDEAVDQAHLERAAEALQTALAARPDSRSQNDLARVNLYQAMQGNLDKPAGLNWLAASHKFQELSLAQAPANAFGWLRLSHIALLRKSVSGGLDSGAVATLFQSIQQSPFYAQMVWRHLEFAMTLWPVLDVSERRQLQPQFLAGAELSVWRLEKMATQRRAVAGVREALAGHPAFLSEFDRRYLHRIKPEF
jgi:hypothetical protein